MIATIFVRWRQILLVAFLLPFFIQLRLLWLLNHSQPDPIGMGMKKKDFVYLIQSHEPTPEGRLLPNEHRDILYLCFRKGCNTSHIPPTDVFTEPNLSWTEGRNSLLNHALQRAKLMPNGGYEYYIFLDEDIRSMVLGYAPWDVFELLLVKKKPAVGYLTGSTAWHKDTRLGAPFNVDGNVNAFHSTTLGLLLPYDITLDSSIYYSQYINNLIVGSAFASQRIGFEDIALDLSDNAHNSNENGKHRREASWSVPKHYMNGLFLAHTAMHKSIELMNCCNSPDDRYCQYEQSSLGPLSGPVDDEWWTRNGNRDHPYVSLMLSFMREHSTLLRQIRSMYGGFILHSAVNSSRGELPQSDESYLRFQAPSQGLGIQLPQDDLSLSSIVYLVQGPANNFLKWAMLINPLPNASLIYHSFDENCTGCLYAKGTTFASGRNLLLQSALMQHGPKKYYVFVDDDIYLTCDGGKHVDCWAKWNEMLLDQSTVSRLVAPKTWHDPIEPTNYQTCVDDAFWAIRHNALNLVFPLPVPKENQSWWHNIHVLWSVFNRCKPLLILSDKRWRANNTLHRAYPKGVNKTLIYKTLGDEFAELGEWSLSNELLKHRCAVQHTPSSCESNLSPACSDGLNRRFQAWIGTFNHSTQID